MEILSPLFAIAFFFMFLFVCQKAHQVLLVYRSRKSLNDIFYQHFQFFIDQAITPYWKSLFPEGHQQEVSRINNMTWQDIASVCNLEMNPSWHTGRVQSIYKSNLLKSIILNKVKSDIAQKNSEIQHQLCIFFEKALPLVEQHQGDADDLGHLIRLEILKKLFSNYPNEETQAKFEERILPLIIEEE